MAHISGHDRSRLLLLPEAVDDYVRAALPRAGGCKTEAVARYAGLDEDTARRALEDLIKRRMVIVDDPSRSSFHATSVSPCRSALRQASRPGLLSRLPDAWSSRGAPVRRRRRAAHRAA